MRHGADARRSRIVTVALVLSCALRPGAALAQRAVDLQVGSWTVDGSNPTLFSAGLWRGLTGPLGLNLRGIALIDRSAGQGSLYGLVPELSLFRGSRRIAPYAVGGAGLAYRSGGSSEFVAVWSAGLGVELNPRSWFGLAVEGSRFVEDEGLRGFWNLQEDDRRGWVLSARVSIRWSARSTGRGAAGATGRSPSASGAYEPVSSTSQPAEPLSNTGFVRAQQIVQTALDAMGEPYRWGGTSTDEGFDCSGLVWYAYGEHGVTVPRTSRDQARVGRAVAPEVSMLEPGDILLFAERGAAVTHVGLYVGNARFIHATTSGGVGISELYADDDYSRWWLERWVGARRVLR
ncbi:MAG: C40 family peptidase [Gemmatimonadota bacterium]|nr:MAG: C40 family peptidase [Gemmatimonadota bacterium]